VAACKEIMQHFTRRIKLLISLKDDGAATEQEGMLQVVQ
jgi:hypothetical protein